MQARTEGSDELEVLNTRVRPHVRIINGALDENPDSPGQVVLNGRIDPATLRFIKFDESYQRPLGDRPDIYSALKDNTVVPNVELGVRGTEFEAVGNDVIIYSPVYAIDGRQRIGTALRLLDNEPAFPLRMFGSIHFNTNEIWERHRFTQLNKNVKKVSPNLHLRNMRDANTAVLTLYGLSRTKDFPLYGRVSWDQNMTRGQLISALVMADSVCQLHNHFVGMPGRSVEHISGALQRIVGIIGLQTFRRNITTFFEVIDECWGLRAIEYSKKSAHVKGGFLFMLGRFFSDHEDFWNNNTFGVVADDRRKLAKFPVNDPHVANLCGSYGASRHVLSTMLVNHMNSGRRLNRLRPRER